MKRFEFNVYDERGNEKIKLTEITEDLLEELINKHKNELTLKDEWTTEYSDYTLKGKQYKFYNYTIFIWETNSEEVK